MKVKAARRAAKDGLVMVALVNAGYVDLLLNWKASVDRLNLTNYVIVPNDLKAAQQLSFLGIDWAYDPDIGLDNASSAGAAMWTADKKDPMYTKWNQVVHKKAAYVRAILNMGLDVLLTDVDIVFLKDPLPLFSDKTIDLFFINDVKLAPPEATGVFICGGFWLGRSNERTMEFVDFVQECEKGGVKEQPCFGKWHASQPQTRGVKMEVMPLDDFPSGYYYFHRFWKTKGGQLVKVKSDPYLVHNNWIVGHDAKLARFREHGLMMWTRNLTEELATFAFDPTLTTHAQLLAFHQRMAADRAQAITTTKPLVDARDDATVHDGGYRLNDATTLFFAVVLVWGCLLASLAVLRRVRARQ